MSKVITSPVERWAGTVKLIDPPTLPVIAAFHTALRNTAQLGKDISVAEFANAMMPAVYACVEKWDLKEWNAFSPDKFPMRPKKEALELAAWLIGEITKHIEEGDQEVPKAS